MKSQVQIYNFHTRFNFGKHEGKTLEEVLLSGESRYIGYCIFLNELRFILDLQTIKDLEKEKFFNDLEFSYYGSTASLPIIGMIIRNKTIDKQWIIDVLMFRLNEFSNDPIGYEKLVYEWWNAGNNTVSITSAIHPS